MRDDFLIDNKLSWNITTGYLLAIALFYILVSERPSILLCLLGLTLTGFLVYLSASLRLRKHNSFLEALKHHEIRPFKQHLGTWYPFMFVIWLLGLLWCWQLSGFLMPKLTSMIVLAEIWTLYVIFFAVSYNDKLNILKNIKDF
jgi:hypothetical protein